MYLEDRANSEALLAARSWIQCHCINGEYVTWGSDDRLNPPLTVRDVEELATAIAKAIVRYFI